MIDIRGDNLYVDVTHTTEWDSTLNNHTGGNKAVIQVNGTGALINMQNDIESLKVDLARMQQEKDAEVMLRNSNPALKDLHEKYMAVYKLVKETMNTIEGNDGGG